MNRLAKLQALLRDNSGDNWDAILRKMEDAGEEEALVPILERLPFLRRIDRALYEAVLLPDLPQEGRAVSFEGVCARKELERVPYRPGFYRPASALRQASKRITPPLRGFCAVAAAHVASRLAENEKRGDTLDPLELDLLYLLLTADESRAGELFERLYARADERYDQAACSDLLDLLAAYRPLPAPLQSLSFTYQIYRRVRRLTAPDYYETKYYLRRPVQEQIFTDFMASGRTWGLNIYAAGGMGKTQFLRWIRARYCALFERRIPCARIDFDDIRELGSTHWRPWFLLPAIFEDWGGQMPGTIFNRPAHQLKDLESMERRSPGSVAFGSEQLLEIIAPVFAQLPSKSLVLMLDTFEEVMLYHQSKALEIIRTMGCLAQTNRPVKIIFSGRYDLMAWLSEQLSAGKLQTDGETANWLGHQLHENLLPTLEIERFTPTESMTYLRECRGLHAGLPLQAAVTKADDNPLKLALLADLMRVKPEIEAAEIESYPDADIAYLIERVVQRIPDNDLQWLLRYGVVLRYLTREVVEQVLAQPIALTGQVGEAADAWPGDDLGWERENLAPVRDKLWQPGGANMADIWRRLMRYVAQYSWVSPAAGDPGRLRFHPDVIKPMRELLAKKHTQAYLWLHRKAFHHYREQMKGARGDVLVAAAREAIYHALSCDLADGYQFWREQIEAARDRFDLYHLGFLAEDILVPAFWQKLDVGTQAQAEMLVADAYVRLARSLSDAGSNASLLYAESWLMRWESRGLNHGDAAYVLARGELMLRRGQSEEAAGLVATARDGDSANQARLAILRAELQLAKDASAEGLHVLVDLEADLPAEEALRVGLLLGDRCAALRQWDRALRHYRRALARAGETVAPAQRLQLERRLGEAAMQAGDFAAAEGIFSKKLPPAEGQGDSERLLFRLSLAEWLAENYRVAEGLAVVDTVLEECEQTLQTRGNHPESARLFQVRARARRQLAALLVLREEPQAALVQLASAGSDETELADDNELFLGHCTAVDVALWHMESPKDAYSSRLEMERLAKLLGPQEAARAGVLVARYAHWADEAEAEKLWDRAIELCRAAAMPLEIIIQCVGGLLESGPRPVPGELWRALVDGLRTVTPPIARLPQLRLLARWPVIAKDYPDAAESLGALLPDRVPDHPSLQLWQAEAMRVTGSSKAAGYLKKAARGFTDNWVGFVAVLAAADRLDVHLALRLQQQGERMQHGIAELPSLRPALAAANLARAQRLWHAGQAKTARSFLDGVWEGYFNAWRTNLRARAYCLRAMMTAENPELAADARQKAKHEYSLIDAVTRRQEWERMVPAPSAAAKEAIMPSRSGTRNKLKRAARGDYNSGYVTHNRDRYRPDDRHGTQNTEARRKRAEATPQAPRGPSGGDAPPEGPHHIQLTLSLRKNTIVAQVACNGQSEQNQVEMDTLPEPWNRLLSNRKNLDEPKSLDLLAQFGNPYHELGALLPSAFWKFLRKGTAAVQFRIEDEFLALLPWELVFKSMEEVHPDYHPIEALSRTNRTLARIRSQAPGPHVLNRRMLAILPPEDSPPEVYRSERDFEAFRERGWSVTALRAPDPDQLFRALYENQPGLIWITCRLRRSASYGSLAFNFLSGPTMRGITSDLDADILEKSFSGIGRPIVVLDTPLPPEESEGWAQIFMRNELARRLTRYDGLTALLGFTTEGESSGMVDLLLHHNLGDCLLQLYRYGDPFSGRRNLLQRAGLLLISDWPDLDLRKL